MVDTLSFYSNRYIMDTILLSLGNPLFYVLVVLFFYAGGLIIAMINYMKNGRVSKPLCLLPIHFYY